MGILQTCHSDVSRALRQWLIPLVERRQWSAQVPPLAISFWIILIYLVIYNIAMERSTIFKNSKPSISMGHQTVSHKSHNQKVLFDRCWKSHSCLTSAFKSDMVRKRLLVSLVDSRKVQPSAASAVSQTSLDVERVCQPAIKPSLSDGCVWKWLVPHCTQWFCWSWSLYKMAMSLGRLTQHFQTNPDHIWCTATGALAVCVCVMDLIDRQFALS